MRAAAPADHEQNVQETVNADMASWIVEFAPRPADGRRCGKENGPVKHTILLGIGDRFLASRGAPGKDRRGSYRGRPI